MKQSPAAVAIVMIFVFLFILLFEASFQDGRCWKEDLIGPSTARHYPFCRHPTWMMLERRTDQRQRDIPGVDLRFEIVNDNSYLYTSSKESLRRHL